MLLAQRDLLGAMKDPRELALGKHSFLLQSQVKKVWTASENTLSLVQQSSRRGSVLSQKVDSRGASVPNSRRGSFVQPVGQGGPGMPGTTSLMSSPTSGPPKLGQGGKGQSQNLSQGQMSPPKLGQIGRSPNQSQMSIKGISQSQISRGNSREGGGTSRGASRQGGQTDAPDNEWMQLRVWCGDRTFDSPYGMQYQGFGKTMFLTPLACRCFYYVTQALHTQSEAHPSDPTLALRSMLLQSQSLGMGGSPQGLDRINYTNTIGTDKGVVPLLATIRGKGSGGKRSAVGALSGALGTSLISVDCLAARSQDLERAVRAAVGTYCWLCVSHLEALDHQQQQFLWTAMSVAVKAIEGSRRQKEADERYFPGELPEGDLASELPQSSQQQGDVGDAFFDCPSAQMSATRICLPKVRQLL